MHNKTNTTAHHTDNRIQLRWQNIPKEMREKAQWCIAGDDKIPRMPNGINASSTNTNTWSDFDTACTSALQKNCHIGFMLHTTDPFTCIDLDIKQGSDPKFIQYCNQTIETFDTFTERSKSGRGFHIWVKGDIGAGCRKGGVEVYSKERFIICTGTSHRNKPIENRDNLVNQLAFSIRGSDIQTKPLPDGPELESDETILKRAFFAHNKDKVIAHYNADWATIGHKDHSKADMALLQMLSLYTKNNAQLQRLFISSQLGKRKKATRKDYLIRTIAEVRRRQTGNNMARSEKIEHGRQIAAVLLRVFDEKTNENNSVIATINKSRIKVLSAEEIIRQPHLRWRIKGILPEVGLAAVYGPAGSGKSFLVLDMLAHISEGKTWFGHKVRQARVTYVAFEGTHGVPQRVIAFKNKYWLPKNITFLEAATINLIIKEDRDALVETLTQHLLTDGVLCIDTLAASAAGIDENSSEGMGKLISELQIIQNTIGGTVLVVHHTGKDKSKGLRGWSGLNGALDTSIEVSNSNDNNRSWTVTKAKDGQNGVSCPFSLETTVISHDEDNDPITSCFVASMQPSDALNHIINLNHRDDDFTWDLIKKINTKGDYPSGRSLEDQRQQINGKPNLTQKRLRASIARLTTENRLIIEKEGGKQGLKAISPEVPLC